MFKNFNNDILKGIIAACLSSVVAFTTPVVASEKTGKLTFHLIDSQGNPIETTRVNECVTTPESPNTPPKPFKRCGYNFDRDEDGITDEQDVCPDNTPLEITNGVYQSGLRKGCPLDSDNDGIENYRDDCPNNTPLEISKGVDSRGCPLDVDRDLVLDYKDLCPGTPYGVEVDESGCTISNEVVKKLILNGDVTFAFDSDELTPQARSILDELVAQISLGSLQSIEIVGHTDNIGAERYNEALSKKRAASVANYLISKGIPYDKIVQQGIGELNPIAPNNDRIGRAKNRRVEVRIRELRS
jgi:OOP family OmpA-OmpF porin